VELVAQYKDHASSTEQEARNSPRVPTTVEITVEIIVVVSDAFALPCG